MLLRNITAGGRNKSVGVYHVVVDVIGVYIQMNFGFLKMYRATCVLYGRTRAAFFSR